jgi:hypothetical protein
LNGNREVRYRKGSDIVVTVEGVMALKNKLSETSLLAANL